MDHLTTTPPRSLLAHAIALRSLITSLVQSRTRISQDDARASETQRDVASKDVKPKRSRRAAAASVGSHSIDSPDDSIVKRYRSRSPPP